MLVLGRKQNETIVIDDCIRITIVGRSGASVRVGIEAPRHVKVMREEVRSRDTAIVTPEFSHDTAMPSTSLS